MPENPLSIGRNWISEKTYKLYKLYKLYISESDSACASRFAVIYL